MKKSLYLLLTILIFACSSGSDNDVLAEDDNSLLIGTWYLVGLKLQGQTQDSVQVCDNNGHREYVEFISPNIANFYYIESASGNNCSDEYILEQMTFTKSENEISIYFYDNLVDIWTITKLNGLSLEATTNYGDELKYSVN